MDIPTPGKLKIIRIADPLFCVRCRHAYIADVLMASGERKKMLYCARRDCDQWITKEVISSAKSTRRTDPGGESLWRMLPERDRSLDRNHSVSRAKPRSLVDSKAFAFLVACLVWLAETAAYATGFRSAEADRERQRKYLGHTL